MVQCQSFDIIFRRQWLWLVGIYPPGNNHLILHVINQGIMFFLPEHWESPMEIVGVDAVVGIRLDLKQTPCRTLFLIKISPKITFSRRSQQKQLNRREACVMRGKRHQGTCDKFTELGFVKAHYSPFIAEIKPEINSFAHHPRTPITAARITAPDMILRQL